MGGIVPDLYGNMHKGEHNKAGKGQHLSNIVLNKLLIKEN